MTTLVNDRDVLIQSTVPRFAPPTDRALLVASSAQVFKVAANNVGSPSSIDLTAKLLNMVGTVAWSASGGSSLSAAGNTATLNFSSMVGLSCTVTATITVDGQVYTSTQIITKVNDGVTGKSSRRAYSKTTLTSLSSTPTTITTAGDTSFPPLDSWGAGTVWGGSPHQLVAGERDMVTDASYDPFTDTTTWQVPYLVYLKVAQLSTLALDAGNITAGDFNGTTMHGGTGYPTNAYTWPTNGGTGYHLSASGLLLGNANLGKYARIDANGDIYTPQFTSINGVAVYSGTFSIANLAAVSALIGLLRTATSGGRMEIADNVQKVFDTSNVMRLRLGNLSL
jgi:hypothetical protein